MHFRASHLPPLAALTYGERWGAMIGAVRTHNRWVAARLAFAFVLMLATVVGVGFIPNMPDDAGTLVAIADGAAFYVYLLWEINGPLFRAVTAYVGTRTDRPA